MLKPLVCCRFLCVCKWLSRCLCVHGQTPSSLTYVPEAWLEADIVSSIVDFISRMCICVCAFLSHFRTCPYRLVVVVPADGIICFIFIQCGSQMYIIAHILHGDIKRTQSVGYSANSP